MNADLGRRAERGHKNSGISKHIGTSPAERTSPDQWSDWLGEQTCTPLSKSEPTSLEQLVTIIRDTGARRQLLRAVGSGHSTSDITRTDGAVLLDPHKMTALMDVDTTILNQGGSNGSLIRVQSGILIKDLNQQLDDRGLALTHMGAYDGQTVSGAMNTGTHGSGAPWGPMASMLRSIVMVTENGTVLQIEPADGAITNALKFPGKLPEAPSVPVTLVQDNDWFHSTQVSMGCMGVVYSYTIEVTAAFHVSENRTTTTWEDIKGQFAPEKFNPLPEPLAAWDRYALEVSPYPSDGDGGKHPCVKTEAKSVGNTPKRGTRNDIWGRILEDVGILLTNSVLDNILNAFPKLAPGAVNTAIDTLQTEDAPYIDTSYNVFKALDTELQLRAHALELHFDARDMIATVDWLIDTFRTIADQKNLYVAGPISIRFIAASDALLAPSAGRLTATAELTNIVGIDKGVELLQEVKSAMSSDPSIRVHWGLDLDTITAQDVRNWYGENMDRWLKVYRQLNVNGMFNNKFTDRIGITVAA
ncbi:FAD-dependent oxidoreductase [Diaporthe sp. PMI_573]|nr:FAD-dependent oxidoreductase [Diaporthaceae sp. PMI_573]